MTSIYCVKIIKKKMLFFVISSFLNKQIEYVCMENSKTIYKYIRQQGSRNEHSDYPGAHISLFMTFI